MERRSVVVARLLLAFALLSPAAARVQAQAAPEPPKARPGRKITQEERQAAAERQKALREAVAKKKSDAAAPEHRRARPTRTPRAK